MSEIVNVESLCKFYSAGRGQVHRAVDQVSFTVTEGEVFGIVGESGSGKTTVARSLLRLTEPTSGSVRVAGIDPWTASSEARRQYREAVQVVFQDPYSSMDPRMRIGSIVAEGLDGSSRSVEMKSKIATLLDKVGIPSSYATLFPHELSGGQRQRVAIARALALDPRVLVADEPVSALDVSMRGQVLNLLMSLQRDLDLTIVFISHDLGIVQQLCNRVAVMHQGKIVEMGDPVHIFQNPKDEYTKQLVASIPKVPSA